MQKIAPFQASKWLEVAALLDTSELIDLFDLVFQSFPQLTIFRAGALVMKDEVELTKVQFIELYQEYLKKLLSSAQEKILSMPFFLTCEKDCIALIESESTSKVMTRLIKPVVQIQFHRFDYSKLDGKFHSMMHGVDAVLWGLHFSYPQLYFDQQQREAINTFEKGRLPNTLVFKEIQQWMRKNTQPTPFVIEDKKVNATFRIGKKCFSWVDQHPQLKNKGLKVFHAS